MENEVEITLRTPYKTPIATWQRFTFTLPTWRIFPVIRPTIDTIFEKKHIEGKIREKQEEFKQNGSGKKERIEN